ncbi:hypothetical protein [Bifidobacterium aesculapii]|uniref:hypothetical protein n=1 Tax=Bifidobacterium aesculapii TaxID=1329411 RepID=UPI001F301763|nr:hypothetical protein [Bifidobacterium aesculapii]
MNDTYDSHDSDTPVKKTAKTPMKTPPHTSADDSAASQASQVTRTTGIPTPATPAASKPAKAKPAMPAKPAATKPTAPKPATPAEDGLKPVSAKSRNITIVATVIALIVVFLALGFFVHWGLAAIFAIIMVPGAISMAIIARHPEKTGGRSMLGVSNPDTLLEPFTGKRK